MCSCIRLARVHEGADFLQHSYQVCESHYCNLAAAEIRSSNPSTATSRRRVASNSTAVTAISPIRIDEGMELQSRGRSVTAELRRTETMNKGEYSSSDSTNGLSKSKRSPGLG